ncbi:high affinity nitrate transporter NrtB [Metarhizium album ARSEF 1941]|uniref:High affinity nitrate transporter NrtB n=1 Tax=Metarhizium album (strain ARSEF 1941) TaxID=1081103 RepID=A0A0B2WVH2_METAS|nr:high affinity nitrate transporter NrtB [Metarhizium album ARSEF 1941]KHO00117.1 high affinity nitrate transporter NrtB [Metarhizium album ARSEF 1941]
MLGFWAWYTFPPLLTVTIKKDLHLGASQVANSNIVSLCATLLLRFVAGPLGDQFGARRVYAALLPLGCLPIGLAPLVETANGLYVSRFLIGILGATFVPCQVWCTSFFDRNIVGTANALAGGWGNAGGGITYFMVPAVFDSLVASQGMEPSTAWRVTFAAPLVCVIARALAMVLLCPDTPVGSWEERSRGLRENQDPSATAVDPSMSGETPGRGEEKAARSDDDSNLYKPPSATSLSAAVSTARAETVLKPVALSSQTLFHVATYACSFGGELAVNSTKAGNYAAIFGFLDLVTRPLGGVAADVLYRPSGRNLWTKKACITTAGLLGGPVLVVVGQVDPSEANGRGVIFALVFRFVEAGNGANFALVFRFVGALHIAVNLAVCWIAPLPEGQVGGGPARQQAHDLCHVHRRSLTVCTDLC